MESCEREMTMIVKTKMIVFLLIFLALSGCITLPTTETKVLSGEKIADEQLVFIEPGVTGKSEITNQLGPPDIYLIDKNIFAYDWQTRRAIMIWAIGNGYQGSVGAADIPKNYVLLVQFDRQDVVRNYEITTRTWFVSYGNHLMDWIQENEKTD